MQQIYIVHELELDETRRGGRGEQEIDVKAAIKFKTREIGCFIADNESAACRFAAEAVERPGKFVATAAAYHRVGLGQANKQTVDALSKDVVKDREQAQKNARRNDR